MGHILPIASVKDFDLTPVGLQHRPTKSIPDKIALLVAAKEAPESPETIDGAILVKHSRVESLCDPQGVLFATEALCTLSDMYVYNMGDGKPRCIVGSVRVAQGSFVVNVMRIFPVPLDLEEAKQFHLAEIAFNHGLESRRGAKQKADTLMEETPLKRHFTA